MARRPVEHRHPPQPQARLSALQSEGRLAVDHARVMQVAGALVIEHGGTTEQRAPLRQRREEHLAEIVAEGHGSDATFAHVIDRTTAGSSGARAVPGTSAEASPVIHRGGVARRATLAS